VAQDVERRSTRTTDDFTLTAIGLPDLIGALRAGRIHGPE